MIRIKRVFGVVPILLLKWGLMPSRFAALSLGLVVLVRSRAWKNEPLIQHELVHCRQAIKGLLLIHALRYWLDKSYRYKSELEAYAVQMKLLMKRGNDSTWIAASLATKYGLSVTVDQAARDLSRSVARLE